MFIDEIKIYIKAGNGGNGAISFRREKYIQNGGPDGGHGGYGGHVIVKASTGESSLNKFYHKRHYKAENGVGGQGDKKNGRKGKNCYVIVPIGTIIYEICTSKQLTESGSEGTPTLRILADLHTEGEEVVVARGGIGGKGNSAFANSVEQAPRIAEHGALGEEKTLFLELRSIADVGLIGFPNAGKSTFLANVTNAKPKIGDYPFTTLIPNVGVRTVSPGNRFTIADIPGIIEGASEGRGLGFKFLRHIERCRLLLYLIDLDTYTPEVCIQHLQTLFQEVKDYDEDLFKRKSVVCGNKIDTENGKDNSPIVDQECKQLDIPYYSISAKDGTSVDTLCQSLYEMVQEIPPLTTEIESYSVKTLGDDEISVSVEDDIYIVHCPRLERIIAGTDLDYPGSLRYVYRMFRKYHIDSVLSFHGIKEDDVVELGGKRFRWI